MLLREGYSLQWPTSLFFNSFQMSKECPVLHRPLHRLLRSWKQGPVHGSLPAVGYRPCTGPSFSCRTISLKPKVTAPSETQWGMPPAALQEWGQPRGCIPEDRWPFEENHSASLLNAMTWVLGARNQEGKCTGSLCALQGLCGLLSCPPRVL